MRSQSSWFGKLDKLTIGLFLFIVLFGWMNIYSTVNPKMEGLGWDWNNEAGRQLLFMGFSGVLIFLVLLSDGRLYEVITVPIYVISALLLVAVLFIGKEVGGNKSWLALGNFGLQPSEFAKLGTALMTARIVSQRGIDLRKWNARWWPIGAIAIPMGLILLQPDTGSAIVFLGFFLVLYREGLPGYLLFLGIGAFLVGILALAFSQTVVFILVGIVVGMVLILERLQHRMKLMQIFKHKAWLKIQE